MTNSLDCSVNLNSAVAVYMQIQNQIQFAIASGRLKPGDRLPSVREMATSLKVNQNTVTRAYRELDLRGVVNSRRGYGITVTTSAPKLARAYCDKAVQAQLREAVGVCLACGYTPAELRTLVSELISAGAAPYTGTGNAGRSAV